VGLAAGTWPGCRVCPVFPRAAGQRPKPPRQHAAAAAAQQQPGRPAQSH
jgi:hypothetical protein